MSNANEVFTVRPHNSIRPSMASPVHPNCLFTIREIIEAGTVVLQSPRKPDFFEAIILKHSTRA